MYNIISTKKLTKHDHLKILRSILIFSNSTALLLYAFLRIIFYNTPISITDDVIALLKTMMIGGASALALYALLLVVELADYFITRRK